MTTHKIWLAAPLCSFAVVACFMPVDVGDNRAALGHGFDAGSPATDAGAPPDAGPNGCPLTGPASQVIPLTGEQADCAGLTSPACAACHQYRQAGCWELRPNLPGVSPPPDAAPAPTHCGITAPPVEDDGGCPLSGPAATVVPLTGDQANCVGITSPACAACHTPKRNGCYELRPMGVPPPPPDVQLVVPGTCGIDAGS